MTFPINVSDECPLSEEEVKNTYDKGFHELVSDVDSSGGLFVGDNSSVKARLENADEDFSEIIESVEKTEEMISDAESFHVEFVEEASTLFKEYAETGDEEKLDEVTTMMEQFCDELEEIMEYYRENVRNPYAERTGTRSGCNVKYAYSYLQDMHYTADHDILMRITQNF